jgi:hypothetical protein
MAKLRVHLLAVLKKQQWRRIHLPLVVVLTGRRTTVLPPSPTKISIPVDPPITLRKRKSHTNTGEEDDLLLLLQRRPCRRHHQVLLTNEESAKRSRNDGRRKVPAGGAKMTESGQRMNAGERKGETGAGRGQDQETVKGISTAKRVRRVVAEAKVVKTLRIASRYAWRV